MFRGTMQLYLPASSSGEYEPDHSIWSRFVVAGLGRRDHDELFRTPAAQLIGAPEVRPVLVSLAADALARLPREQELAARGSLVYVSSTPATPSGPDYRVPLVVTRENDSDICVQVFARNLQVCIEACEYVATVLQLPMARRTPLALGGDIAVAPDRHAETVVVGRQLGRTKRARMRQAATDHPWSMKFALTTWALGAASAGSSTLTHVPLAIGLSIIGVSSPAVATVANAGWKYPPFVWTVAYVNRTHVTLAASRMPAHEGGRRRRRARLRGREARVRAKHED